MTAPDTVTPPTPTAGREEVAAASPFRRLLTFGTGFGIAIGPGNLEAAIVRSRPAGATLVAGATIRDFRARPAAEWGAELLRYLEGAREPHLAATVLLPRDEVIVRVIHLPGVADKDLPGAIELQIDMLHPFGDDEVAWAWMRAGNSCVVGVVRKTLLDAWETLFSEAGIPVAAFTFSAAAIHAALRIRNIPAAAMLIFWTDERGQTEIYGESGARPLYSSAFAVPAQRALALSRAELRLPPDYPALSPGEAIPGSTGLASTAALAASAPLVSRFANLLPAERRASSARRQYLLPAILGALLMAGLIGAFVVFPAMEQRSYLAALKAEVHALEPRALHAQELEKRAGVNRGRITALDEIRRRPQADLDVLNELTRLLPAQVWTSSIEIYPDSVLIAGEADQAAPLLKLLDSSPLFQNSEFALSVTHNAQNEQFRIKTMRRGRTGRTTP
ncbi:MAG: PilN domain-containing protein [Acidobacteriota bacterium]